MILFKTKKNLIKHIENLENIINNIEVSHRMFAEMSYHEYNENIKKISGSLGEMRDKYGRLPTPCLFCHNIVHPSKDDFNLIFSDFINLYQEEIYPFWKKFDAKFTSFPRNYYSGFFRWSKHFHKIDTFSLNQIRNAN